jgi:Terpene cyclase DEP1
MSSRSITLILVLAGFGVLTTLALMDVGYFGIIEPHFRSWGEAQVLADLVILAVLACVWMTNDARERGLASWPFVLITLVAGSFGPLLYLLVREFRSPAADSARIGAATRATS